MAQLKKPITIGSSTIIDFPKAGIRHVPAKVDTGADSSSLWASGIKRADTELRFKFLGPTSPFYTGETIITKNFTSSWVKNSFGHAELRYKVKLRIIIEGQVINARFTLSNRSENNYPVLIGRRTLNKRFIVDVSRPGSKKQFNVLVIKSRPVKQNGSFDSFLKSVEQEKKKIKFTYTTYGDLVFNFKSKRLSVKIGKTGKDIASFDLVHFMLVTTHKDTCSALAQYLRSRNVAYIDKAAADYYQSLTKLHQYLVLQKAGIRIPKSIYMDKDAMLKSYDYIVENLGRPFILKDIRGKKGLNIFLIKDEKKFKSALSQTGEISFIAQKFIPNDGDYRVLVFGDSIKLVIHRKAQDGSYLNNTSAAGSAALVDKSELPLGIRRQTLRVAESMQLDLAGVDMLQDKETGLWYCLEVNESPQLVSGAFVNEKKRAFSEYLEEELTK